MCSGKLPMKCILCPEFSYLEVIQWVQRVDAGYATDVQSHQNVSIILAGVPDALSAQEKVWFEGPEHPGTGWRDHQHADGTSLFRARSHRQVFDVSLFNVYFEVTEETLAPEISRPVPRIHAKKKKNGMMSTMIFRPFQNAMMILDYQVILYAYHSKFSSSTTSKVIKRSLFTRCCRLVAAASVNKISNVYNGQRLVHTKKMTKKKCKTMTQ